MFEKLSWKHARKERHTLLRDSRKKLLCVSEYVCKRMPVQSGVYLPVWMVAALLVRAFLHDRTAKIFCPYTVAICWARDVHFMRIMAQRHELGFGGH